MLLDSGVMECGFAYCETIYLKTRAGAMNRGYEEDALWKASRSGGEFGPNCGQNLRLLHLSWVLTWCRIFYLVA